MRFAMVAAATAAFLLPMGVSAQSYDVVSGFGSSNYSYSYGSDDGFTLTTPLKATSGCYGQSALSCYNVSGANDDSLPLVAKNTGTGAVNFATVSVPTDQLLLHPGAAATFSDVVLTFTAPTAGQYNIAGAFSRLDTTTSFDPNNGGTNNNGVYAQIYRTIVSGTSTSALVFDTGTTLSNLMGVSPGTTSSFNINETLNAGDLISFAVYNNGNYAYDSTGLRALITAVPEPTSWAMMIVGIGGIGFGLRRRRSAVALVAA